MLISKIQGDCLLFFPSLRETCKHTSRKVVEDFAEQDKQQKVPRETLSRIFYIFWFFLFLSGFFFLFDLSEMRERMSRIVRRERRFHESCKKLFIAFEFWLKSRHGISRQAAWARRARVTESIRTFRLSLSAKSSPPEHGATVAVMSLVCCLLCVCMDFRQAEKTVCINEMVRLSRLFRLPHDEERNCQMNKLMFKQWMRNIWTKFQIGCCRRAGEKRGWWSTTQSRRVWARGGGHRWGFLKMSTCLNKTTKYWNWDSRLFTAPLSFELSANSQSP